MIPKLSNWLDWRNMSPQKAVSLLFVVSVLVLVVGYAVWQLGRLISPLLDVSQGNLTLIMNSSDREQDGTPLPNALDGGAPFYNYSTGEGPTLLPVVGGRVNLARLDLRLNYQGDPAPTEEPMMRIQLPPRIIFTPNQLRIEGNVFNFVNGQFTPPTQGGFTVSATIDNPGSGILESYRIDITGFEPDGAAYLPGTDRIAGIKRFMESNLAHAYTPPPASTICALAIAECTLPVYDLQLTFDPAVTESEVSQLASAVGAGNEFVSVRDAECATTTAQTHICFWPTIELSNFIDGRSDSDRLLQAIELSANNIIVHGNTLGSRSIGGFIIPEGQRWVAVGGTVSANVSPDQGQLLNDYVQGNAKLQWGDGSAGTVGYRLTQLKNSGIPKATVFTGDQSAFYLNSRTSDPGTAGESSFSSGPSGKLWHIAGDLRLTNSTVTGAGTVIVNGNLVVDGPLNCAAGTRFGVIATGNITFNNPDIDCGAYVALGETATGNITFNSTISSRVTAAGIFIAKGNIFLPEVNAGSSYEIFYDTAFALEPSALFSDVLQIVFSTTS